MSKLIFLLCLILSLNIAWPIEFKRSKFSSLLKKFHGGFNFDTKWSSSKNIIFPITVSCFLLIYPVSAQEKASKTFANFATTSITSLVPPANTPTIPPPKQVIDIMKDRYAELTAEVTGVKVNEFRVGESLVERLRSIDRELELLQKDIYKDDNLDWNVISIYPKIFRAYSPLFTEYTDRAFPLNSPVDSALRYALR